MWDREIRRVSGSSEHQLARGVYAQGGDWLTETRSPGCRLFQTAGGVLMSAVNINNALCDCTCVRCCMIVYRRVG